MAPISSSNVIDALTAADRRTLLDVARATIAGGTQGRSATIANLDAQTPALRLPAATFVTLKVGAELRGCIGTLEAFQPLIVDTVDNAYAAAFRDPRFPSLTADETDCVDVHVSILGTPEPITFDSESSLIAQLRPGIDGLILSEDGRRGTFLPAVWESVPDPREFLGHLKLKVGLPRDYWSDTVKFYRYVTASIP